MRLPLVRWPEMTSADIEGADVSNWIAILPLAAIEQHGPHLPLGTDMYIMEGMLNGAMSAIPRSIQATFLPIQPVGISLEHSRFAGTLGLKTTHAHAVWADIIDDLRQSGILKLVIISSHGGNMACMEGVALEKRYAGDMAIVCTNWRRFGVPDGLFSADELRFGIHAGAVETSLMMHLHPQLVRRSKLADFPSREAAHHQQFSHLTAHGAHHFAWLADDLNRSGAVGNSLAADAEKGRLILTHQVNAFAELLQDISNFDISQLKSASPAPAKS